MKIKGGPFQLEGLRLIGKEKSKIQVILLWIQNIDKTMYFQQ